VGANNPRGGDHRLHHRRGRQVFAESSSRHVDHFREWWLEQVSLPYRRRQHAFVELVQSAADRHAMGEPCHLDARLLQQVFFAPTDICLFKRQTRGSASERISNLDRAVLKAIETRRSLASRALLREITDATVGFVAKQ
jgi:hypothetical protein